MTAEHINGLANETSPYLLQHAHNPVDWLPWGETALARARREDKPIVLSVGYSACHWCHVMAHESFEDPETAQVMNARFVNIKVDREERPDLDKVYQLAHQILTQRGGGWPLTMFLAPGTLIPFFGGTYFPRHSRHGLPEFKEVLRRVSEFYRDHRDEIERQNELMSEALSRINPGSPSPETALSAEPLDLSRNQLGQLFDAQHGGFGEAPKFPHPPHLGFLLRHWAATALAHEPDNMALEMVTLTLDSMADGGLYDHLAGGFYRYSVDKHWTIPHFEKMLYDNAQLLANYSEACQATGSQAYARVVHQTAAWVMGDMQSPEGGYFSTRDADSEGQEGEYYLWDGGQFSSLLSEEEYRVAARHYGLEQAPNFEGRW
ncbi:MAG TPA: thioredoxin domain-containing protein, partial [Gammaproteobacteria bacterium]|nr:thioredoxin domain-containing protein [Gammaproteobacteria bacterium]